MVARAREGERGDAGQKVQTFSYKVSKFGGSNMRHGIYRQRYSTAYLKVAKRVGLKCSHHKQKDVYVR